MTNFHITPKNSTELWKKHIKWYILLFLEHQKKIKWHTKYYPKDQIGWDALIDDPYELGFDAPIENPDEISWDASDKDLEKEWPKYIDLLSFYYHELQRDAPLLDHEQEFWLAMDIQAGLRINQAISSDGISGVYGDLRDNWDQYSTVVESLGLPSMDWDRAVSEMTQQRLNGECVRFSEIFPWLESANDHTEIRQKISKHATRIYLDLIILPVAALLMIAGHFTKDDLTLPDGNEIDHWFKPDPVIEWPVDEIFTRADQAKEQLILSNLRLVIYIAKRYRGWGGEFADLIQQGNLGLIHTIDKYDPSKGYKVSTYAFYWIKKKIKCYIDNYSRLIRLPINVLKKRYLVLQAWEQLCQQLQRLPTTNEIAETLDSTPATKVAKILEFNKKPKSWDEPVDESDDDVLLEDIVEDPDQTNRLNVVDLYPLAKDIQNVLNDIPANQREVIKLRFGFDGQGRTFNEVGDTLGVPEERIRKLEAAALKYLRQPARSKLLRKYLESIQD